MVFNMESIADQAGRLAIVTGANSGLGYEITLAMVKKGINVVMACRSRKKAEAAKQNIIENVPSANLEILLVDLSNLASVRNAAKEFRSTHETLDILINNAGIMYPPYSKTEDGFESQMGTNCFGHYLFTSLLIDLFPNTSKSRITWLSSSAHKAGRVNFDDIHFEKKYSRIASYGQSKLVCLIYALELDRKLKTAGKKILSNCAHPGGAYTQLSRNMPKWAFRLLRYTILPLITQPAADGALPILEAALAPTAKGGEYYGPQGFLEMTGSPGLATIARHAQDIDVSRKLWQLSERLTGASYHL